MERNRGTEVTVQKYHKIVSDNEMRIDSKDLTGFCHYLFTPQTAKDSKILLRGDRILCSKAPPKFGSLGLLICC